MSDIQLYASNSNTTYFPVSGDEHVGWRYLCFRYSASQPHGPGGIWDDPEPGWAVPPPVSCSREFVVYDVAQANFVTRRR